MGGNNDSISSKEGSDPLSLLDETPSLSITEVSDDLFAAITVNEIDVIINATSLGLNNETINLNFKNINNDKLFYDIIYNPTETKFLKEGKKLGNQTENGKLMFIYQAIEAFKLWHGIEPQINQEIFKKLKND